ncbi:hypothetical protein HNQ77_001848 [Silvibacterium bohemicum]|uniref:Uncharacterized protein n=1 Tax=Silvibacterium bohemicum TaxID=1577686 RepID=A0A841JVX8_9BACT|nr:ribbon-helix-helix domain-containing protein [Silvibacterium bohemicum]MBB6143899.1 hypothetical protein [Silvibacterium bohemicum]
MRTTLSLDDDVLEQVKQFAEGRKISLGRAASELIRRGANRPVKTKIVHGLHVFDPPADSPVVTLEHIRKIQDQLDAEEVEDALKCR